MRVEMYFLKNDFSVVYSRKKMHRESSLCIVTSMIKYQLLMTNGRTVLREHQSTYINEWLRKEELLIFKMQFPSLCGVGNGKTRRWLETTDWRLEAWAVSSAWLRLCVVGSPWGNGLNVSVSESAALIGKWKAREGIPSLSLCTTPLLAFFLIR